MTESVLSL